jgi:CRP/FNR family transcriptional regulator, cyclic AMP receptor protein
LGAIVRSKDKKAELLGQVELFGACTKKELLRIASLADQTTFPKGAVLMKEGEPGREAFVLASGTVDATIRGKKVNTLKAGAIVGELSLLDHGPRTATITAASDVEALVLDPASFRSLMHDVPTVAVKVATAIATRLRQRDAAAV